MGERAGMSPERTVLARRIGSAMRGFVVVLLSVLAAVLSTCGGSGATMSDSEAWTGPPLASGEDTTRTQVAVGAWPERAVYRPRALVAGSGVAGGVMWLSHMRWSNWGSTRATGRGVLTYRTCEGGCATGPRRSVPATVTLLTPRRNCRVPNADWTAYTVWRFPVFTEIIVRGPGVGMWRSITAAAAYCRR